MTALPTSVALRQTHDVSWVTAAPLWPSIIGGTPEPEQLAGMQRPALLRLETDDFMTADWSHLPYELLAKISTRIINQVKGVNRVVYDISSKPPATIEWE